jgi:hypothetical protein
MTYDGPVRRTPELERVLGLPRRPADFKAQQWVDLAWSWTPQLLNDAGRAEWDRIVALPQEMRDREFARFARRADQFDEYGVPGVDCPLLLSSEQAAMLYEGFHCNGLFASAGVGTGKTLVSWLLALIWGAERPLLLVPGSLVQDTHDKFRSLARYWKAPRPIPEVVSFEILSHPDNNLILCDCKACARTKDEPARPGGLRPTHVIVDETHKFRNPAASCTRWMGHFMSRHPATVYAGMTGTAWRKSIKNVAPQLIWALKFRAPVPLSYKETQEWCEALDLSTRAAPRDPGALCLLAGVDPATVPTYDQRVEVAAEGFRNRLIETPGFIQTAGQSCDMPLTIRLIKGPDDPRLDAAFKHFRETGKTLDGWDVADPLTGLKHATEMSCDFYYEWSPRPPDEYLLKRAIASKFVREKIVASARSGKPLFSQAPVYREYGHLPELAEWKEAEAAFGEPNVVARPISVSLLAWAVEWIRLNGPALVWVQHDYVGQALSAMSGVPYFASKGKDAGGRYIGKHSPKESAILSLRANSTGRNLQAWCRALVLGPSPAATDWEQGYLGRMHRQGQDKAVWIDVVIRCTENVNAIRNARQEALWGFSRTKAEQKLLTANFDWAHLPLAELEALPANHPSRPRWAAADFEAAQTPMLMAA